MVLENDTKHDRVCKSVTEINDHAKNFPNAPRIFKIPNLTDKLISFQLVFFVI